MANQNDAEITLGVKLDTTGLKEELQQQLTDIYNNVGGNKFFTAPATNNWSQMPFYQAHNTGGNVWATNAFMSGMSKDLNAMGYSAETDTYQNGMMAAGVHNVLPNAIARNGMLRAYGFSDAASMAHPGSDFNRIMERNYRLMNESWARDYITDNAVEKPVLTPTGRQKKHRGPDGNWVYDSVTETDYQADFQGMRERAVAMGIAKWTDDEKHDASTFKFIDEELEKIEEKSVQTKKDFIDWHDTLKGVLGTLTAITGLARKIDTVAVAGVVDAAANAPNTRSFFGMDMFNVLRTQKASEVLSLSPNAIYDDISKLSTQRQLFKTLGEGFDALPASLLNVFSTISETTDPFEAYKTVAQALLDATKNTAPGSEARQQINALMSKMGYSSMLELVGALANTKDGLGKDYENVASIFDFKVDNPYRSSYNEVESLNSKLTEINNSIEASYQQMYNDWVKTFGIPFRRWWDSLLKNNILPFVSLRDNMQRDFLNEVMAGNVGKGKKTEQENLDWYNNQGFRNVSESGWARHESSYTVAEAKAGFNLDNDVNNWTSEEQNIMTHYEKGKDITKYFWHDLNKVAVDADKISNAGNVSYQRAKRLMEWYISSGYGRFLHNGKDDNIDIPLENLGHKYLMTGDESLFDKFATELNKNNPVINEIKQTLERISEDLGNDELFNIKLQLQLTDVYGNNLTSDIMQGRYNATITR